VITIGEVGVGVKITAIPGRHDRLLLKG